MSRFTPLLSLPLVAIIVVSIISTQDRYDHAKAAALVGTSVLAWSHCAPLIHKAAMSAQSDEFDRDYKAVIACNKLFVGVSQFNNELTR